MGALRDWEIAAALFFVYTLAVAAIDPWRRAPKRRRAVAFGVAGLALTAAAVMLPAGRLLHDWLFPPVLLLLGYWSSGALFVAPMPAAERWLLAIDRRLHVRSIAGRTPALLADVLELAYAGIYALIPIALALHLAYASDASAERFWTVILVIDFICFGTMPWLQTRPPRSLEAGEPWASRVRAFNRTVVESASIQVNTIPSGHAAEGLAAALLVVAAPPAVAIAMLVAGLAVAAGAVLGRYHYALDVFAGWAVAVLVWALL